ncbi:LysR family transcriptional regulator [Compostimonas suwonensis]|uniref:Molybdate transport repressor ModE-like protein n=1 Tax=Compostimonas suwonensis TaxID=1048394 RepID=A0A2M9BBD5_9MICO|nr:LysR family transcriptional regulator [Compostimonas suwonensis]PJJ55244.1 molybdate transport repressor ModE-like protein [Compostimonas suwonensis]
MTLSLPPLAALELDSHTLRIVQAIDRSGSITAAARALGYSQPAISQHLRRLEGRIGMPIVHRVGRRVRLTDAGLVLVRHARAVTLALDAAANELAELSGLHAGRVRLAAFPTASATLVPGIVGELAIDHPGVEVSYLEAEPPEALRSLHAHESDLAVVFRYPGESEAPEEGAGALETWDLGRDEMLVVLGEGSGLAASDAIDLADLAEERWIAGCPQCRGRLLAVCERDGFVPRIGYETDNFVAVMRMVQAGLGVALLPGLALEATPLPAGVVARPTTRGDYRTVQLAALRSERRSPVLSATIDLIRGRGRR